MSADSVGSCLLIGWWPGIGRLPNWGENAGEGNVLATLIVYLPKH